VLVDTGTSLVFNRSDTLTVSANISGSGTVANSGGATNILNLNGLQDYAVLNANAGTTNVNGAFVTGSSNVNVNAGAKANFAVSQTINALTVGANGIVKLTASVPFADAGPSVAAVPEPGTIGLLVVGALGVLARRRRKA
jgi:hypothetical protein